MQSNENEHIVATLIYLDTCANPEIACAPYCRRESVYVYVFVYVFAWLRQWAAVRDWYHWFSVLRR
jgi:hypothetical protein